MATLKNLAGQTVIYGASRVIVKMLNYLLVPYLTRVMTQVEYGVYTDIYSIIPFFLVILTMGMESGYFRFAAKETTREGKRDVFATTWGAISAVSLVFFVLLMLFSRPVAGVMGYSDHVSYVWLMGGLVVLDAINAIPFAKLRQEGRAKRYMLVNVVTVLVNIVCVLFFYSWLPSLAGRGILTSIYNPDFGPGYAFMANLLASGATLLLLIPSCDGIRPRIKPKLLRSIAVFSFPLLVSGIAGTANEFIDRQMIKYLLPSGEALASVGVYGAITRIAAVMVIFTQMYKLAAEPFFLAEFKKEDFRTANAEAMKYYIIVGILIFLAVGLFPDLFALIVGKDFREGIGMLPMLLLSNLMAGVVFNLSFWYKQSGATKYALYITGTGLLFTLVFNIMLVPYLGYYGAAIARLVCETAMVLMSYFINQKHDPIPYDLRRIGGYALLGAVLYVAGFFIGGLPGWGKYFLNIALVAIFALYAVRKEKIDVRGLVRSVLKRK